MSNSTDIESVAAAPLVPTDPDTGLDAHGYNPADYDWVPVLRKKRADGWTPQRQRAFIGHLADTGSVTDAAGQVAMTPQSAYALRRAPGGESFARAWDAAMHQAAYALVDLAFDRAFNGSDEPIYNAEGRRVGRRHRQSDAMIMFLLRKHFPDRYGDLHRDRPDRTATIPAPAVAETMIALGPVQPADPLAHLHPDTANVDLYMAEMCDGELAHSYRQDGSRERKREEEQARFDAAVSEEVEKLMREADPEWYAEMDAQRAEQAEIDREERDRRRRRRR